MRLPLSLALLAAVALGPPAAAAPVPCAPWTVRVVASGLGSLENLEPDGRGGLYVSASTQGAVLRLTRSGAPAVAVAGVTSPGGLRVRQGGLLFTTGDAAASGLLGTADGTLQRLDLRTGRRTVVASGLRMPNGLVFLPDGSALTSRDIAGLQPSGITRISPSGVVQERWSDQADSNGLAVDPSGRWLYSDETFTATSRVYRTEIAHPARRTVVASLAAVGVPKGLDDLTLASSGALYVTANGAGEVLRLDPRTGQSCVIASGLQNPSAVKQGRDRAFPASRLYVSGFDGRLLELVPPPGVRP
ncbi:MAG: hypothetical protein JWN87_1185 [Frankiales bacterium]|nr:hypothetical protein [Frankiales bacterium]